MVRVFTNDTSLFNTQHYKVWIKGKWGNPGKGVVPSLHLGVVAIEKEAFRLPLLTLYIHTVGGAYPLV